MHLLAIDTSTRRIGVAVQNRSETLNEQTWMSPFHHTVELAPAVELALRRAGLTVNDIGAIAIAIGPGSFTALRTGLAFAKGLAFQRDLPLIGIPSLDVLANGQPRSGLPVLALLEAGRKRLAGAIYHPGGEGWETNGPAELFTIDEVIQRLNAPTWVCGELGESGRERLSDVPNAHLAPPSLCIRRPAILAELALARLDAGELEDASAIAPIYLSSAGAEP